jgi:hypothetical protein
MAPKGAVKVLRSHLAAAATLPTAAAAAPLSLSLALCLCIFLMCNANILKSRAGAKELLIYGCHKIVLLHCLSNGNRFMASLMQANFN